MGAKGDFLGKMTFEGRPHELEKKTAPGRWYSKCKGSELGTIAACSRDSETAAKGVGLGSPREAGVHRASL